MQPDEPHNEQQGFFDRFFSGDRVLWVIIAILSIASLLVIYSSTASMAYRKAGGDTAHYFLQQLKFIVLGFAAMIAVHRIDYQRYARPRFLSFVFVTALLFMLLTFFVGVNLNSASRWIRIPLIGVTFQPSDFLRIALIAILARQLAKRQTNIHRMPLLPALTLRGWRKNPDKNFNILTNITIPVLGPIGDRLRRDFYFQFFDGGDHVLHLSDHALCRACPRAGVVAAGRAGVRDDGLRRVGDVRLQYRAVAYVGQPAWDRGYDE